MPTLGQIDIIDGERWIVTAIDIPSGRVTKREREQDHRDRVTLDPQDPTRTIAESRARKNPQTIEQPTMIMIPASGPEVIRLSDYVGSIVTDYTLDIIDIHLGQGERKEVLLPSGKTVVLQRLERD